MNKTEKTFSFISVKDSFFKARYEVLDESTGDNHVITYENKAPVHPSLSEALQRMAYHVVNFTGLVAVDDNFQITGYQRQNCGDAQLLTIYARVGTSEEFCGNVVSRFHIGRDEYASIDLLLEDLSSCEREALAYIETGKRLEHDVFIRLDNDDLQTLPPDEKAYSYHRLPPGRPGGSLPDAPDYGRKRFARLHLFVWRGIRVFLRPVSEKMDGVRQPTQHLPGRTMQHLERGRKLSL